MSWWLIPLLLVAAFGPVLWILPSRRDRLLAKLRSEARRRGLLVELTRLPDLAAPPEARVSAGGKPRAAMLSCTAYRQPLPRGVNHAPRWRLLALTPGVMPGIAPRSPRDAGPVPGWVFDGAAAGDDRYWQECAKRLSRLPEVAIGVEADRNQVAVFWRERVNIEQIDSMLDSLVEALQGLADWQWEVEQDALARLSGTPRETD
jgi:hypothetical protein